MRMRRTTQLAPWSAVLALFFCPALTAAQDGQPATGEPVTTPETNELKPRLQTSTPPLGTSDQVLSGVPATPSDPAPMGTRAVPAASATAPTGLPPAELPGTPDRALVPRRNPEAAVPGRLVPEPPILDRRADAPGPKRAIAGSVYVEGVVTKISAAENDKPGSIRLTVDPSQDWVAFAAEGPRVIDSTPERASAKIEAKIQSDRARLARDLANGADEKTIAADKRQLARDQSRLQTDVATRDENPDGTADRSGLVDLTILPGFSRIVTFARNPDGVDLFGSATESSPDHRASRTGLTHRPGFEAAGPKETNFTNIREGSFVAVRYRRVDEANEVLNLSLIEFPLVDPTGRTPGSSAISGPRPNPGSGRIGPVGSNVNRAGPVPPALVPSPVRVPRIPSTPVVPLALPR